ncbi:MAG: hypothetical protein NC826_06550, partial [Candidatus Omnitrophica bacterium]|nr:hypothetical protein [Candidatus Omnitrophota bacterium]
SLKIGGMSLMPLSPPPGTKRFVIPVQSNNVPKVVIKEGIRALVVIKPFMKPRNNPTEITINATRNKSNLILYNLRKIREQNRSAEGIERSNSPTIRSKPTPKRMMPNSDILTKVILRFSIVKK